MGLKIIGLLPMGGNGTRLGMPFPKPLAPAIFDTGIEPLYRHTLGQVRVVADVVYAIVNTKACGCLRDALEADGVDLIETSERTLPGALAHVGARLWSDYGDVLVAVALPDSIWRVEPDKSFADVVDAVRGDGAFALFHSGPGELDGVEVEGGRVKSVIPKTRFSLPGIGWGAFVVRAKVLASLTPDETEGPQLGRLDMGWANLGEYVDLGTPERYIRWHDTRWWLNGKR